MMEEAIGNAGAFAVTHCPCRVKHAMVEEACDHPTEVCLKFNEMAEFLIEKGFARKITRDEALDIIQKSADAGLVHFVDNAGGDIQHNCNCCGCACWNVGPIKRRLAPRDAIMATYFIRETDEDACISCGDCVDICPVDAVTMDDDRPFVDLEWCIGCGVCSNPCPVDAVSMTLRPDRTAQLPAESFRGLHQLILENKGLTQPG
jgi:Fe-S-cluster-containing hydrogenase component 2